jgi:hypothetical protein
VEKSAIGSMQRNKLDGLQASFELYIPGSRLTPSSSKSTVSTFRGAVAKLESHQIRH